MDQSQIIVSPSLIWAMFLIVVLDHYTQLGFLGPCCTSILTMAIGLEFISMVGHSLVGARLYGPGGMFLLLSRRVRSSMLFLKGPVGKYFGSLFVADSNQLQYALTEQQHFIPALQVNRESVQQIDRLYGERSAQRAEELINRAYILGMMGNHAQSEAVSDEALAILNAVPEAPANTISLCFALNNLGVALVDQHKVPQSLALFERALEIKKAKMPKSTINIATAYSNVGYAMLCGGQFAESEKYSRQALSILGKRARQAPELHAIILNNLGDALTSLGNLDEAEDCLRKSLSIREKILSKRHPHRAYSYHNLGKLTFQQNKLEESRQYFEKALSIRQSFPGEKRELNSTLIEYTRTLKQLGCEAEAEALLEVHRLSRKTIAQDCGGSKSSGDEQIDESIASSRALPAWLRSGGSCSSDSEDDLPESQCGVGTTDGAWYEDHKEQN